MQVGTPITSTIRTVLNTLFICFAVVGASYAQQNVRLRVEKPGGRVYKDFALGDILTFSTREFPKIKRTEQIEGFLLKDQQLIMNGQLIAFEEIHTIYDIRRNFQKGGKLLEKLGLGLAAYFAISQLFETTFAWPYLAGAGFLYGFGKLLGLLSRKKYVLTNKAHLRYLDLRMRIPNSEDEDVLLLRPDLKIHVPKKVIKP